MPEADSDLTADTDVTADETPDETADTAHFRAFAARGDDLPAPWQMRAAGAKIGILAVVVVVVAILAAIIGSLLT